MKLKRTTVVLLTVSAFFAFAANVYAGGHHGGGHHGMRVSSVAWHRSTDDYRGHYSTECIENDHAWHSSVKGSYYGHYAYECDDYGHNYEHKTCDSGYHH